MCWCVSVCLSVCLAVCLHDNSKNNGSVHLIFEHIVVYENSSDKFDNWALSDQGQGHGVTLKFIINRNYRVLMSVCVCVSLCVSVCLSDSVSVYMITQKIGLMVQSTLKT